MRLVSANIEGDLHLDKVLPFLSRQDADVICLQEVFRDDLATLADAMHTTQFLPMCLKPNRHGLWSEWGLAIASRPEVLETSQFYYHRPDPGMVRFEESAKRQTVAQGALALRLAVDAAELTVIATHFTWTPDGAPDDTQTTDMDALLHQLSRFAPHLLCGDFNIPRKQNRLYQNLAARYTDHIPQHVASSIYVPLHYARHKPGVAEKLASFMVDYVFSTPGSCKITNVELHGGISDHMAITAEVAAYLPA
jgi:endonuclease/exonuclease/phosphatase family metal-dependent hydrolase